MAKRNYSVSEILSLVDEEGIGYAILNTNHSSIKDEDLSDMWERASEILLEIREYLDDNGDKVDDSEEVDPDGRDDSYDND